MLVLTVRLVVSLALVLGLLVLLARVGQRRFRGNRDAMIRVLHRQSLSRSSAVSVVAVGSRVLVLGTTEQQVRVLAELDPEEVAEPDPLDGSDDVEGGDDEERTLTALPGGALAGSLLSADTWRQAMAVATKRMSAR